MKTRSGTRVRHSGARLYLELALAAAVAATALAALTGLASASSPPTLAIAKHVKVKTAIENVAVSTKGVTVYTLSGETTHHLECSKANQCFTAWFPVKVSARAHLTAAHGIHGKLGKLHRNGFTQVTLGGRPLYTFIGDGGKKRMATGEGIVSFGGTWHVVATSSSSGNPTTTTTSTTSTTSTNPYQY
jgi:predicted lipoprotein with Yx(FWY)xxD motif